MSVDLKLGALSADQLRDRLQSARVDQVDKSKDVTKSGGALKQEKLQDAEFKQELQKKIEQKEIHPEGLKFSAHAKSRLMSRGIELTPDEIVRMQEAIQKMDEKGSKESLILTDKAAFVVSVKNSTVITAVDKDSMKENVFTNIDSTIMI
jgi:flagellar operon protein